MSAEISDRRRLLGFAFASADFLVEIDRDGTILFLTGAAGEFTSTPLLVGTPLRGLFDAEDGARFAAQIPRLPVASRTNMHLKLKGHGAANIAMFRMPDNGGRISCALTQGDPHAGAQAETIDRKTGLPKADAFVVTAAAKAVDTDALTLVNLPGLPKICAELPVEKADALMAAIGLSFTHSGTKAAGRLSATAFGALADARSGPKTQIPAVRAAISRNGLPPTDIHESHVSMKGPNLRPEQRLLALRHVVDHFASGKQHGAPSGDLGQAFEAMMDETQERLIKLTDTVASGAFAMAYQPIKNLKTLELRHFEALARFGSGQTGETIQFVEKLGISDSFDLAVVMKVVKALESDTSHAAHVAFNVSGHTIQTPATFGMLVGLLARHKKLAPRLLIEVTETAEITDIAAAVTAIETLRALGYRVGLDDFGAGAATLNYLQAFHVDFVKFDGSLVKRLGASARDDTMLKAMLKLCHELGYATIAECLETEDDITRARDAGFDDGQGYALGAPGKIPAGAGITKIVARRRGTIESWE